MPLWVFLLTRFSYIICFHFLSFHELFPRCRCDAGAFFFLFLTIYESILLDGVAALAQLMAVIRTTQHLAFVYRYTSKSI